MRRRFAGAAAVRMATLGATTLVLAVAAALPSSASALAPRFAAVRSSVPATTDVDTGAYRSASMSIEVVLAPAHGAQLKTLLADLYNAEQRELPALADQGPVRGAVRSQQRGEVGRRQVPGGQWPAR